MNELAQELASLISSLITNAKCACHIINPHKTRILMWKQVENNQTVYYLRIGIQKFVSQEQQDRNGNTYWRYYEIKTDTEPTNLEAFTKFEVYDKSSSSTNSAS